VGTLVSTLAPALPTQEVDTADDFPSSHNCLLTAMVLVRVLLDSEWDGKKIIVPQVYCCLLLL
jgi:hypothetical protein